VPYKIIYQDYSYTPKGLSLALKILANFLDRITELYEQGADVRRIGKYVSVICRALRKFNYSNLISNN